jgi:hypothetical protein
MSGASGLLGLLSGARGLLGRLCPIGQRWTRTLLSPSTVVSRAAPGGGRAAPNRDTPPKKLQKYRKTTVDQDPTLSVLFQPTTHARNLSHLMLRYTGASESGRGRGGPWPLAWPALAQKRVSGAAPPAATAPLAGRREKLASGSPVLSQFTDCVSKSPKT